MYVDREKSAGLRWRRESVVSLIRQWRRRGIGPRKNSTDDFSRRLAHDSHHDSRFRAGFSFSARLVSGYLARVITNNLSEGEMPRVSTPMDGIFIGALPESALVTHHARRHGNFQLPCDQALRPCAIIVTREARGRSGYTDLSS